jgi:aspartate/methionine/tyrosine aminotransferase
MKNTPVNYQIAKQIIESYHLPDFGKATIREVVAISTQLEQETKTEFIHMEMGVPGLKPAQVGIDAEIKALKDGVASIYPNINGIPEVKERSFTLYQGIYKYQHRS